MKKLKILLANPNGNITIFVLTPCEQKDYQSIAQSLLRCKELKGEQVGFIKKIGKENSLEMADMEFCGNAGRAFGLYCAKTQNITDFTKVVIHETGTDQLLHVEVNPQTNYTKIKMPAPVRILPWPLPEIKLKEQPILVDLGGIVHVVLRDEKASQKTFETIKRAIYQKLQPDALGVMFYASQEQSLVPIVYVKKLNTTYWEGSCASGSQATAVALSWLNKATKGKFSYTLKQPAGKITASVEKSRGKILASYVEGYVEFSPLQEIVI